ncbi:hypothetical protein BGZ83_002529, partial [Gryganskiella cystojenkinii]
RSSGRTESPQASLAIHGKPDRQQQPLDQRRESSSAFNHSNANANNNHGSHIHNQYHGPPYSGPPQHLSSFKGPSSSAMLSGSAAATYGPGAGASGSNVVNSAVSSLPTRPGSGPTAADPHFQSPPPPSPSPAGSYHQQFHDQSGSDYRERPTIQTNVGPQQLQQQSAVRGYGSSTGRDGLEDSRRYPPPPLTAPLSSSSSNSSLWSSPRAYVQPQPEHGTSPGGLGGNSGAAGPFRQRHTSLPQVLNYHSPAIPSPTREQPSAQHLQFQHHSHSHQQQQHHHQQQQQQQHPQQYPPQSPHQHAHQPHHSSTHQHQYPSIQHQQPQHGPPSRAPYQTTPTQSTFHQSSPRIPHGYEGSSPRASYFPTDAASYQDPQRPVSPSGRIGGGRLSSDRGPPPPESTLEDHGGAYGELEDRRQLLLSGRRISQPQPPTHGYGSDHHRSRISSLGHTGDIRDPLGFDSHSRTGMQTPPRGSDGLSYSAGVPPSINNNSMRSSGPSPLLHQQQNPQQQQQQSATSVVSPSTGQSRGPRHSLTVSTLPSTSQISSSSLTTPTTSSTSRGDNTGSRVQFHAPLEPEVIARLDDIFFKFLQRICSDLKASDSRGDHIHQPLMAKKMQRLEASTEFRPFKFRIQAFTNAFHESLILHGLTEDILPLRKVKVYLWKHRYISRFNEDGKKQKSKGNHVWNIEARRIAPLIIPPTDSGNASSTDSAPASASTTTSSGSGSSLGLSTLSSASGNAAAVGEGGVPIRWEFREYSSRIAGQIIKFARVGIPYVYSPRIWDAQMSCPDAKFSSPWLPGWLKWKKGELKGTPGPDDESCTITVIAEYVREGEECRLEMSFPLTVSDPSKEGDLMDSQNEQENENENENDDDDELEDDDEDDHSNSNGNGNGSSNGHNKPRSSGRKLQGHPQQQSKKQLQSQSQKQEPYLVQVQQQHQQQQQSQQQYPYPSYSQAAGGAPQAGMTTSNEDPGNYRRGSGGGGSSDNEEGDEDEAEDDDEMEYISGEDHLSANNDEGDGGDHPRKKSRERRSLVLVDESQDSKRRKHIK